jgi:hypothetical protein
MKTKEENMYRTTNFYIAVWLMMNNHNVIDIEWGTSKRAEFIFEDFDDRSLLIQDYFKQEQLQRYISNSQELKARMYASQSPALYD